MKRIAFAWMCCLLALGACKAGDGAWQADLAHPADGTRVTLDHVQRSGAAEATREGATLQGYAFQPSALPQLGVEPAKGGWDWSGQGELHVQVRNAMPWAVTLGIDIDGIAHGQRLHATVGLPPGPAQTLAIPLHATSPRAFGMQAGPPMPFAAEGGSRVLATTVEGGLDPRRVGAIRFSVPAPQAVQTLRFGRLAVVPGTPTLHAAYAGIVDRYGQYTRGQWPEKIDGDEALRRAQARAQAGLATQAPAGLDAYGGRMDGQALERTGWFHTQKSAGRWQLVTPDGHPFFSLGVNAATSDGGRSYVEGREWMFKDLPPASGPWAGFYGVGDSRNGDVGANAGLGYDHGRWFDFYAANLRRLDGDGWQPAWRARTLERLRAWGFNTIGNWSDEAVARAHRMAFTRSINIAGDYGNVATGYDYWGRMPDPFDPRFAQAAEAAAAKAAQGVRDDPWLLGYFADNELAWAGAGPQGRWALAQGTLRGEPRSAAKQAFIAMLRKQYGAPEKLGSAWGIALGDWQALEATGFAAPAPDEAHPAIAADYGAWLRRYADAYFRTVAEAIRRHDPHHLFLGGRFAVNTPEAVAACARYCDVVSFNVYADLPQHGIDLAALHALDKPVLVSEFHFGSDDRGPFGKGVVSVWNEAQRGEAYARFVAAAAGDPAIVGAHWFEYADQPVSGRLLDGENSHVGLVGITDLPFGSFVEAVRAANAQALRKP
ncbi:beta-agarase [Frateuria sp. Soil773]|uniref:hypothetical protein n=1 Tax=Frateuria sp. Soil773 TaxID=1736407 RepID=UPI0006F2501C|nr:hypothetical protein [Frateuria sp. Soil773]KRE97009.1 beta-agarase [Frateuria sp. Soil773]